MSAFSANLREQASHVKVSAFVCACNPSVRGPWAALPIGAMLRFLGRRLPAKASQGRSATVYGIVMTIRLRTVKSGKA